MTIAMDGAALEALKKTLDGLEDAQQTGDQEYVLDLYEHEPPLTMELAFEKAGLAVLACEELSYSEDLEGYYLAGPFGDAAELEKILREL